MSEAKLQKLKVTDLKDLLAKHSLVQTGKKDDLIKRLLDNGITGDEDSGEAHNDPQAVPSTEATHDDPTSSAPPPPIDTTNTPKPDLTPEQSAMKARAERFGIPFNPNPSPTSRAASAKTNTKPDISTKTEPATPTSTSTDTKKAGAAAIDKAPVGVTAEQLAQRAAKYGLPAKKEEKAEVPKKDVSSNGSKVTKEEEMTPEMKERIAIEEEKKRKRAEKFGTGSATTTTNGTWVESDAKKVKM